MCQMPECGAPECGLSDQSPGARSSTSIPQGHHQLKGTNTALAGVAQWIERRPENQRVASLIPSQGTCLGCGPGPQQGAHERQTPIDVSVPLFVPSFPALKINK